MRRTLNAVAVGVVALTLIAACGDDDDEPASTPATTTQPGDASSLHASRRVR